MGSYPPFPQTPPIPVGVLGVSGTITTVSATNPLPVIASGGGSNAAAGPTGSAVPLSGSYTAFNSGGNLVGVSVANPLPVSASFSDPAEGTPGAAVPASAIQIGGTDGANLRAVATDASGQVKVLVENTPAVTLASTTITGNVTVQQSSGANLHVDVDNFPATQPVSGTVAVTQSTSPWVVSLASTTITGTVGVTQSTSPWVTQPTTGGVYSHNLNQDGSGNVGVNVQNFPATQPVSGSVAVTNLPATQPVSGSVTATIPDLGNDRIIRNVLEDISATMRELTDFMYTLRDQFQYVLTPIQGTVQVGNFPPPVNAVSVSNFPAVQAASVPDAMSDRVVRNLLEEILITLLDMRAAKILLNPSGTMQSISVVEGIN